MSNIDLSKLITAEDKAAAALAAAQAAAHLNLVTWINEVTHAITGPVPEDEKLSWPSKEQAARAVLAANATTEQTAMIADEAQVGGETSADLAANIVANADAYWAAIAPLTGLRRKAAAEINAAQTREDAIGAVTAAQQAWAAAQS